MFEITIHDIGDDAYIIEVAGEFIMQNLADIETEWERALAQRPRSVAFDCGRVVMLDSSGIGFMVKMRNAAVEYGVSLVFCDPSETVSLVFETTKLNDFFTTMTETEFRAFAARAK